jgi:hypothetical protein
MSTALLRRQLETLKRTLETRPVRPAPEPVTDEQIARGYVNLVGYVASRWPAPRWDHATEVVDWFTALPDPSEEQVARFLHDIHQAFQEAVAAPPDAATAEE